MIAKIFLLITVLLALCYIVISQREILTFESKGNTKAYRNLSWSYSDPPDLIIPKNTLLPAVGCKDIKTDILVQVEKNGVIYNISDGAYLLRREKIGFWELIINPRATYSCKGLFKNETKAILPGNA